MKGIKLVALLALLALTLSLLTGCAPKKVDAPPEGPARAQNIKPPTPEAEPADFGSLAQAMGGKIKGLKSWRATMTGPAEGGEFKMAIMGKKVRVEDATRPNTYQVLDLTSGTMLMVDTDKKTAMEMKLDIGEDEKVPDPAEEIEKIQQDDPNAKFSSTQLDGRPAWLVEYKDKAGNSSKSWFDKEWGLPLKIESTTDGKTETLVYTYSDINSVPASDFEAPAGYKIVKMDMTDPTQMTPEQLQEMQQFMGE